MDVVIGFIGSPYSANESAGVVVMHVDVLSGSLQIELIISLLTKDVSNHYTGK